MKTLKFLIIAVIISISYTQTCHYSCQTCNTVDYYQCTVCKPNRGNSGVPIYGMCYCSTDSDEDSNGNCQSLNSYNSSNKGLILAFIIITIILSSFAIFAKGMKYFLYKTIEDVQ